MTTAHPIPVVPPVREARALWTAYVRDLASNLTHTDRPCDPERGGKPSMDCDKCILDAAMAEADGLARQVQRLTAQVQAYRDAGACSALEVMPSGAAIDRAAAWLAAWDDHDHPPFENLSPANRQAWRVVATTMLRAAAGLPAETP